ncbi:MAG: hypothetical protein D4R90_03810 [Nitrosopumilales archaeon]|nr:MAG: hypothetical protein D4R90_03810 [Nitrosopumilales archaeon]
MFISIIALTIALVALSTNVVIPQYVHSTNWSRDSAIDLKYIQGIINSPIKEVTAANSGLSDTTMASSFVVHFKTASINFDIYTISKITQPTNININGKQATSSSQIQFESIPSKDKKKYYDLLSYYVNTNGDGRDTVDVNIDILAKDGSTIETLQYSKCIASSYYVINNDNKLQYRFAQADVMELRDQAIFTCQGEHIVVPTYK